MCHNTPLPTLPKCEPNRVICKRLLDRALKEKSLNNRAYMQALALLRQYPNDFYIEKVGMVSGREDAGTIYYGVKLIHTFVIPNKLKR